MRWLLHGTMTPAVADALRRRGDSVTESSTVGVTDASPHADVLQAAAKAQLDLMTSDAKLAESPFAPEAPPFGRSIVYLQLEGGDVEQDDAVERLFDRYKRLTPGRLYTVTGTRVKIRQLPGRR
jgi:predicted nuclease of predicted toxin-antitoxin system